MQLADLVLSITALIVAVVVVLLKVRLYVRWRELGAQARTVRNGLVRTEAWRAEARRIRAWRQPVVEATEAVNDAVQLGASIARVGHGALASVSFGVFNRIPRTRERSRHMQERHKEFSQGLYAAIEEFGDGATEATRKNLLGDDPIGNQ